jgi:hypothetical protein
MEKNTLKPESKKREEGDEQEKLPGCTEPSDPEYSRAWNKDEPCDDGRAG